MANKSDAKTLEEIKSAVRYCRANNIPPEEFMCDGVDIYRKAIKSIRNVGTWAIDLIILGLIAMIIMKIAGLNVWGGPLEIIIYIVAIILLSQIALKIYELGVTPYAMLVLILLVIPIAPFAMPIFISVILIIPIIIALVRWSTYRNWYNDVKKRIRKIEKANK